MKIGQKKQQFISQNPKKSLQFQLKRTIRTKLHTQQSYPNSKTNRNNSNIIGHNHKLITRIKENYQDLKSIVPNNLSDKKPKQSIKTYNKQKYAQISGAAYLMIKSKISKDHPQKKHLNRADYYQKDNNNSKTEFKQKRHYQQSYKQKQKQNRMDQLNNLPRKHSQTFYKKIDNDLYSKIEFKQNMENLTVKMSDKNMFKTGKDLGYDDIKKPKVTKAKQRELIGSNMLAIPVIQKNKRDDWIKSSIVFG